MATEKVLELSSGAIIEKSISFLTPGDIISINHGGTGATSAEDSATALGVGIGNSPIFVTAKLSILTDGYIPYHVGDATGLVNSPIFTDGTKVGIGTAVPSEKLHVYGASGVIGMTFEAGDSNANIVISASSVSGTGDPQLYFFGAKTASWKIYSDTSETNKPLFFYDYASATTPLILSNGNVGIGITPTDKLHVSGNINFESGIITRGFYTREFIVSAASLDTTAAIVLTFVTSGSWKGHFIEIFAGITYLSGSTPYSSIARYSIASLETTTPCVVTDMTHDLANGVTEAVSISNNVVTVTLTSPHNIDAITILVKEVSGTVGLSSVTMS
ncbi:MAG: hypothetical protein O8C67_06100 [Candidatus Methanoperedens sp.]|nr:hypothetical protein [Candidatus Methanoperedens sp.]